MVSLVDIYPIKEKTFNKVNELKKFGNPARGDKAKDREEEFYFIDEPMDPETGAVSSKVVYKRSFKNMTGDLEAEAIDMKKLSDEYPEDMVLYTIAEDLKDLFNKFRTHVRKKYKDE